MNFTAARLSKISSWSWKKIATVMNLITIVGEIALGIYWFYVLNWSGKYPYQPYITHLLAPAAIALAALFILILIVWLSEPEAITAKRENIDSSINPSGNNSGTNNNPTLPSSVPTTGDANTTNPPSIGQNHSANGVPVAQTPMDNRPPEDNKQNQGVNPSHSIQTPPTPPTEEHIYSLQELRYFIVPNEGKTPLYCQDKCAINHDNGRFAVTDGVSNSFLPAKWAEIIATSYVNRSNDFINPDDIIAWLTACSKYWKDWAKEWIDDSVKMGHREDWNQQLWKGAKTTFAGCSIHKNTGDSYTIHIDAVGDANFFHLHLPNPTMQNDVPTCYAFPNSIPRRDDAFPETLSTSSRRLQNAPTLIKAQNIQARHGDYLFLVTDALMNWILTPSESAGNRLEELLRIDRESSFRTFVEQERDRKTLEEDDTTMLIIPL